MTPSAPRTRGAVPSHTARRNANGKCSPHPRGCSRDDHARRCGHDVLPAPAGLFPSSRPGSARKRGAPRTRGAVPMTAPGAFLAVLCSPHPRGCSPPPAVVAAAEAVLPAPAGLFPTRRLREARRHRAPRTRGAVPLRNAFWIAGKSCSPHPRGCSLLRHHQRPDGLVLPAPAGLFPASCFAALVSSRAPRTRGAVPVTEREREYRHQVLPAPAGLFPPSRPSRTA